MVFPGDLVVFDHVATIEKLVHAHRLGKRDKTASAACTMQLADVGEQDEHGAPEGVRQTKEGRADKRRGRN